MNKLNFGYERKKQIKKEACSKKCFCFSELLLSFFVYYLMLVGIRFVFVLLDQSETLTFSIFLAPILVIFVFPFFSIVLLYSESSYALVPLFTPLIIYLLILNSRKNRHNSLRVLVNSFGMLIIFGAPTIIIAYSGYFYA
jgi:hypothetical protein